VALIATGKQHLLAVANWDSRAVDLYTSNEKPLDDPACRFELLTRWRDVQADKSNWQLDKSFAAHQSINLFRGKGGALQLVGFATMPNGDDVVDLYALDPSQSADKLLRKLSRTPLKFEGGAHFSSAAGLWIDNGKPVVLATPRNVSAQAVIRLAR
jgi:hypothetical protein